MYTNYHLFHKYLFLPGDSRQERPSLGSQGWEGRLSLWGEEVERLKDKVPSQPTLQSSLSPASLSPDALGVPARAWGWEGSGAPWRLLTRGPAPSDWGESPARRRLPTWPSTSGPSPGTPKRLYSRRPRGSAPGLAGGTGFSPGPPAPALRLLLGLNKYPFCGARTS